MRYLRFTDPSGVLNGEVKLGTGDSLTINSGETSHFVHKSNRGMISLIEDEILLPLYKSRVGLFKFPPECTELARVESLENQVVLTPLIDGVQYIHVEVRNFLSRHFFGDKKYSQNLNCNHRFSLPLSAGRDLHIAQILEFAAFTLNDKPIADDPTVKQSLRDYFRKITKESYS